MADWTCTECGWVNRDFSAECLSCGAPHKLSADPLTLVFWGFAVVLAGYVVIKAVMTPELPPEPTAAGPVR